MGGINKKFCQLKAGLQVVLDRDQYHLDIEFVEKVMRCQIDERIYFFISSLLSEINGINDMRSDCGAIARH